MGTRELANSPSARTVGRARTGCNLRSQATLTCRSIMSSKNIPLGTQEHEILRAIARTATASALAVPLSSTQRLRFEMLGLIEDRADGIRLTERGRAIAAAPSETPQAAPRDLQQHASAPRDRRGRRLGLQASLSILRNLGRQVPADGVRRRGGATGQRRVPTNRSARCSSGRPGGRSPASSGSPRPCRRSARSRASSCRD